MTTHGTIDISEVVRSHTICIRLSGVKKQRFRLLLGAKLMHLATWIIGCKCEMEITK